MGVIIGICKNTPRRNLESRSLIYIRTSHCSTKKRTRIRHDRSTRNTKQYTVAPFSKRTRGAGSRDHAAGSITRILDFWKDVFRLLTAGGTKRQDFHNLMYTAGAGSRCGLLPPFVFVQVADCRKLRIRGIFVSKISRIFQEKPFAIQNAVRVNSKHLGHNEGH